MKPILTLVLALFFCSTVSGQSIVICTPGYELQLTDFRSSQTGINNKLNSSLIQTGTNMDFNFQMTSGEFMFPKNFNSKVTTRFNRNAAAITAPDTATALQLVDFGQYSFDLTELYSRKFRKQLYEQKKAFSDVSFFQSIFNRLQEEMSEETARVMKKTDLGRKEELLVLEHAKVLNQIEELSDFCKECKPPKKKKKKGRHN